MSVESTSLVERGGRGGIQTILGDWLISKERKTRAAISVLPRPGRKNFLSPGKKERIGIKNCSKEI